MHAAGGWPVASGQAAPACSVMAEGRLGAIAKRQLGLLGAQGKQRCRPQSRGTGGSSGCPGWRPNSRSPWNKGRLLWRTLRKRNRLISSRSAGHQLSATAPQASGRSCSSASEHQHLKIAVDQPQGQVAAPGRIHRARGWCEPWRPCCRANRGCCIAGAGVDHHLLIHEPCTDRQGRRRAAFRLVPHESSERLRHREGSAWRETKGPLPPQLRRSLWVYPIWWQSG